MFPKLCWDVGPWHWLVIKIISGSTALGYVGTLIDHMTWLSAFKVDSILIGILQHEACRILHTKGLRASSTFQSLCPRP